MSAPPNTNALAYRAREGTDFTTTDPERAHVFMRHAYTDSTMRIKGNQNGFQMRHTYHDAGPFSAATMSHTMAVEHIAQPLGELLLGRVLDGQLERETCGETLCAGQGDVFLIAPPERPHTVRWDNVSLQLVSIDQSLLTGVADDSSGERTVPPMFTSYQPASAGTARQCARVLEFVTSDLLPDAQAVRSPLIVDSAARMLSAALLTTFPNTLLADEDSPSGTGATSAALARATEFVDSHAHLPIGLPEIAEAAYVSPRSLQLLFRHHLDTTPTEYLRRARLDRAHYELLAADPGCGDNVTAIATRWGFGHHGRFASLYRDVYGRTPRQTLYDNG